MTWIKIISYDEAEGKLIKLYNKIKGPKNYIDNVVLAHSLRPNTLEGRMALYKNVLHHQNNTLPKWLLEAIGSYVSWLNSCAYCYRHHTTGMARNLNDKDATNLIKKALEEDNPSAYFKGRELAIMGYTKKLTTEPGRLSKDDIIPLRDAGVSDGEVLEINQVVAYFAYANRSVLGLGVDTEGEIIGLSPGNDSDDGDWQHK